MAYMSQEKKKEINAKLKPVLKRWGMKGSLSVRHHSTLVLTLREGRLDPKSEINAENWTREPGDYLDINVYHYQRHYVGNTLRFLNEILPILNDGNWDKSDIMTDYFNVGWYVDVTFGRWDKPYKVAA